MKIELKLGNSAGIVYGNCPAVFSRPGVTCETSCNVVCDIALWWSPRTNQRACIVRALYLRERNVSAIRCWQIAGSWKECRRTESFLQTRFCTLRACYRNDRVRNACNVVPQRYSRQHEYYFVDISWKIGNIAGNAADKTESLGKIRNKSRIILVYGVNKWCKVSE